MLSRDEVHRRLETFRAPPAAPSLLTSFGIGGEVRGMLGLLGDRTYDVDPQALAEQIDRLPAKKRVKLFSAFMPRLGADVERLWEWSVDQPFQTGPTRRPYRSRSREVSASRRLQHVQEIARATRHYPQDLEWLAQYAGWVAPYSFSTGLLFASAISAGHVKVRDRLVDAALGRDEIGSMGHHVVIGLLASEDPSAWSVVADLLVRAQRQEGLRQVILETVDFADPIAFRSMLDVVVEHRLTRFAATVRAAAVWLGESFEVRQDAQVLGHLARLRQLLDAPPDLPALADPVDVYLALWCRGFHDVDEAVRAAAPLLSADDAELRLAAARFVASTGVPQAYDVLTPALNDTDDRVVAVAVNHYPLGGYGFVPPDVPQLSPEQVSRLLESMHRLRRVQQVQVGLLGSCELPLGAATVADRLIAFTPRDQEPMVRDAFEAASAVGRRVRVARLAEDPVTHRAALLEHVGDAAAEPRRIATEALGRSVTAISEDEALALEALLTRKTSELRRACLDLLRRQPPAGVAASAARLEAGTVEQQKAGRELHGVAGTPGVPSTPARRVRPVELEIDHSRRTPVSPPVPPPVPPGQAERCSRLATSLVAWLDEHKDVEVRVGSEVKLLADVTWLPISDQFGPDSDVPLPEILLPWWDRARPQLTDGGLEAALLSTYADCLARGRYVERPDWLRRAAAELVGSRAAVLTGWGLAAAVMRFFARDLRVSWAGPLLDAHAWVLAAMPTGSFTTAAVLDTARRNAGKPVWQHTSDDPRRDLRSGWAVLDRLLTRGDLPAEHLARAWALARYLDEPGGRHDPRTDPMMPSPDRASRLGLSEDHPEAREPVQVQRMRPPVRLAARAYELGIATDDDMLDLLTSSVQWGRSPIYDLTARLPEPWVRDCPKTLAMVERVRRAALQFELSRGEFETDVSGVVSALRTAYGIPTFVAYLAGLGRGNLVRGYVWRPGRDSALSQVIRKVLPAPGETVADFAAAVGDSAIPHRRLLEVGVYAPQWAAHVEHALGWPGYENAVWWLHAHTKGDDWTVDRDLRNEWTSQVAQRTPLDAEDLVRGAVDVVWFREVLAELGADRFDAVLKAAKFASTAGGHKRAELFARALRGQLTEGELLDRITAKRHQDSVRALGLLPLPHGEEDDVVLRRYELLRGFVASDRTSGSQRRASESTAVDIGLENLARTAGFRDPQRLTWSMEAHAVRDLAAGDVSASDGDLVVTLSIDATGTPGLAVRRGATVLKAVPKGSATHPDIAALTARVAGLRKQTSRMRQSLERASVLGEVFAQAELADLLRHPVLRPMLADLVLVTEDGRLGFATESASVLTDELGSPVPVDGCSVRVAHPLDLLASGRWPAFQRALFRDRRRQPFRQVFRELYTLTDTEQDRRDTSARYAGHQIQARQAAGIFRSRGWVADFDVGFGRTFHAEKLTAWCSVLGMWGTPGEVEDATIDTVTFHRARQWSPIPLSDVPPRLFSEVMRDLDLVVSVAHAGGLNPETSEAAVDMRARLVEETAELLGLTNVETTDHHAMVKGTLSTYSVNLGSGVVHRQPGNAVCIVPIGAQHRGRVFLPFVDDDPRTAEVVSKVVLLARDDKIQDPSILAQLR